MSFKKFCDTCGKEITSESDETQVGFSEWCLFHHKKRRDFCSGDCIQKFLLTYFNLKIISPEKLNQMKTIIEEMEK